MSNIPTSKDLPLLSNADTFRIKHYMIKLKCNFETRTFDGMLVIFIEPTAEDSSNTKDVISAKSENGSILCVLDSKDLIISDICELECDDDDTGSIDTRLSSQISTFDKVGSPLKYKVEPWCVKFWKSGVTDCERFPKAVRISYVTKPEGASVTWTKDQDGRDCVFTQGAWINNRSLFPCQEPPVAMATWQAWIDVPYGTKVVMSGDNKPTVSEANGRNVYYYRVQMKLPMSTLALAIGSWCSYEVCDVGICESCFYAPSSLIDRMKDEFCDYVKKCLHAATELLGPYPFKRFDVLILPRCFSGLGLANPNLIFLSQSVLCGDGSMSIRIAHEVSHSWFGLLIGASDWTEEWLSEGFATFMEDQIHFSAQKVNAATRADLGEIRALLRFRNISAELENTDEELQKLRPCPTAEAVADNVQSKYVKNGMNADNSFTQVHYLKGYFLLRHLRDAAGNDAFLNFLRSYVRKFAKKLVLTNELLEFFFQYFNDSKFDGLKEVCCRWLDNPGMPQELENFRINDDNKMYKEVKDQYGKWFSAIAGTNRKKRRRKKKMAADNFQPLFGDQLVLLLEMLTELKKKISRDVLESLNGVYALDRRNADVLHRWCELIVKNKYVAKYRLVEYFLTEHQSMGVYLYGELILSEDSTLQGIAVDCYETLREEMDYSVRITVEELLGDSRMEIK